MNVPQNNEVAPERLLYETEKIWHHLQRKNMEINWSLAISDSSFQYSDEVSDMEQNKIHTQKSCYVCVVWFIKLSSNNSEKAQHKGNCKQDHLKNLQRQEVYNRINGSINKQIIPCEGTMHKFYKVEWAYLTEPGNLSRNIFCFLWKNV